jgi:hypothetical protein
MSRRASKLSIGQVCASVLTVVASDTLGSTSLS